MMRSAVIEELLQPQHHEPVRDFDDFEASKQVESGGSALNLDEFRRKPNKRKLGATADTFSLGGAGRKRDKKAEENEDAFFLESAGLNVKRYAAAPRRKLVKTEAENRDEIEDDDHDDGDTDTETFDMTSSSANNMEVDDVKADITLEKRQKPAGVSLFGKANAIRPRRDGDDDKRDEDSLSNEVRAHFDLFDSLLELRISTHSLNAAVNTLPQLGDFNQFITLTKQRELEANRIVVVADESSSSTNSECYTLRQVATARKGLLSLIHKLLKVDSELSRRSGSNGVDAKVDTAGTRQNDSSSDQLETLLQNMERNLNDQLTSFRSDRDSILTNWQQRTRLASAFAKFERPVADQITAYTNDVQSIQKTRLRRSEFRILGTRDDDKATETPETGVETPFSVGAEDLLAANSRRMDASGRLYDAETFDDDDFYQKQIREFLALNALANPGNDDETRQSHAALISELDAAKRRRKSKKVDTRASKARRLRFTVHPKLVNFLAPVAPIHSVISTLANREVDADHLNEWTDEKREALFSALFRTNTSESE